MASSATIPSTFNAAVAGKRKQRDVAKLLMSDYKVTQSKTNKNDMVIEFAGPKDSIYEGGLWKVHVLLPDQYPYKSPSIGFLNKIFHPNVDEASGSVCLDVINQTWSPMFELVNIFDNFLPQLLNYPNPSDPLNSEAASYMNQDYKRYVAKVRDYVLRFAQPPQQQQPQQSPALLPQVPELLDKVLLNRDSRTLSSSTAASGLSRRESQNIEDDANSTRKLSNELSQSSGSFDSVLERPEDADEDEGNVNNQEREEEENLTDISIDNLSELSENADIDEDAVACFA